MTMKQDKISLMLGAASLLAIATPGTARAQDAASTGDTTSKSADTDDAGQDHRAENAPALPAAAQPESQAANKPNAGTGKATGDWGGLRTRLFNDGITFRGDYVSESFTVISGGQRKGTAYTQQLRGGVDLDMDKIVGWKGGTIHVTFNDRRGHGMSSDFIGNRLPIQEAYGGLYTKITEVSVEQELAHGLVDVRLGYFAMGNDLGGVSTGCNFVNAAFCAHPLSMSGDTSWFNYPNARWGGALRVKLRHDLYLRTGAFLVNPALGLEKNAFDIFAGHTTGTILPVELEYLTGENGHGLPGSVKVGVYFDTADSTRSGTGTPVNGRWGAYVLAKQMLWRAPDGHRSVSMLGTFTYNPRTAAQITRWYSGGLFMTGTFKGRDHDTVGVAVAYARVNPRLIAAQLPVQPVLVTDESALPPGETVIELEYGIQLKSWLILRPDMQYVIHPRAFSYAHAGDAVVAGAQIKAQF